MRRSLHPPCRRRRTDPQSGRPLVDDRLVPNACLRALIAWSAGLQQPPADPHSAVGGDPAGLPAAVDGSGATQPPARSG